MEEYNEQAFLSQKEENNKTTDKRIEELRRFILEINRKVDDILIEVNKLTKPTKSIQHEYFKNKDEYYFLDKTIKDILYDYNNFKDSINPKEDDLTLKQLNRIIKRIYPNIKIQRTTHKGKQIFAFRLEESDDFEWKNIIFK